MRYPGLSGGGNRSAIAGLLALLCAAGLGACASVRGPTVVLPYVTVRDPVSGPPFYGDERGAPAAGFCRARLSDQQVGAARVRGVEEWSLAEVFSTLAPDGASIVVYVHGYGEGFRKACARAAQLQRLLRLEGRLLLFTWPAGGNPLGYRRDVEKIRWSIDHLDALLRALAAEHGTSRVDVLAHSLGARGALEVVAPDERPTEPIRIGRLVLIAPDVSREAFAEQLQATAAGVSEITVYVSPKDRLLYLSGAMNQAERLGQAVPSELLHDRVTIVDVSPTGRSNWTGHVYHLFNPAVVEDLREVFGTGEETDRRWRREPLGREGVYALR